MNDEQIEALLSAAPAGVAFDDLQVRRDSDGYVFAVPGLDREGLSEARVRKLAHENPWYVSNWYYWTHEVGRPDDGGLGVGGEADDSPEDSRDGAPSRESHRYAFLRWVERAEALSVPERYEALSEDLTRRWGQLLITARVGTDGQRWYDVRHVDDEGTDAAELETHADPQDLRELVKFDAKGRYRPLKSAPSLPADWTVTDLDGADLVSAVDTVYPATIANWHLEQRDALDVTHWEETAERQTGIYGVIEDLPDEAVEWVAEACCVDSQCLKRRAWDRAAGDELDVPRGDGEFPCREPCSLVVAAARKWTKLEEEETRTYEFDLTPSEKEQLEAIVEAVADGRIDEIREADVYEGANRYRARYLRAKRFDEEGRLSGTPTDAE
jgi:hypothetical protein